MKIARNFLLFLLVTLLLSACASSKTSGSVVPTPQAGKTTVTGVLVSEADGKPAASIIVRLAEVYREGNSAAYALDASFSPGATSDENGVFIISDIAPGEYVVIIGDPAINYMIIEDSATGKAKVWNAPENGILDLGTFTINF